MGPIVAALLILGIALFPTMLFLELWNLLEKMRDDELVERAHERTKHQHAAASGSPSGTTSHPGLAKASGVQCDNCNTINEEEVKYCRQCLSKL